jgi:kumamolisin
MNTTPRRQGLATAALLGLIGAVFDRSAIARSAATEVVAPIPGHVLAAAPSAVALPASPADGSTLLTLTVVLRRNDVPGFDRYLHDVYDPSSPSYRRFLSGQAMADRFGPSRPAYDALAAHFAAAGFAIVDRAGSRV